MVGNRFQLRETIGPIGPCIMVLDTHLCEMVFCNNAYSWTTRMCICRFICDELNKEFDYYESQIMDFCFSDKLSIEPYRGMVWSRISLNEEFEVLPF